MPDSPERKDPNEWLRKRPDPVPWDVPLDETVAHIHFQGDVKGKYDGPDGARRLFEEREDRSLLARFKRFFGLQN